MSFSFTGIAFDFVKGYTILLRINYHYKPYLTQFLEILNLFSPLKVNNTQNIIIVSYI